MRATASEISKNASCGLFIPLKQQRLFSAFKTYRFQLSVSVSIVIFDISVKKVLYAICKQHVP